MKRQHTRQTAFRLPIETHRALVAMSARISRERKIAKPPLSRLVSAILAEALVVTGDLKP